MDAKTDAALVTEALAGQGDAFAALVRRYQDHAYGLAIGRLSDFDLARDVVQEAFLCAYRDLHKLRDRARFGGWLCGIVRHTAHRALRELDRVRVLAEDIGHGSEPVATTPTPDRCAEDAERREIVRRALASLNEKNREAVSLYYVDGLSYADIAEFIGVTEATVQGRLQRARAQLRKELAMVEETFKHEELPDDFSVEIRRLFDAAAADSAEREKAARRLAEIGAPAVDPLCAALKDPRIPVRQAAARALCTIGDARALRPILQVLYSEDYLTGNSLFRSGRVLAIPGVRDELLKIARGDHAGWQYWAILALSHAEGDEKVEQCLRGLLRDSSAAAATRAHALMGLCGLRPDLAADLITEALSIPELRPLSGGAWWMAIRNGVVLPIETCRLGFSREVAANSRQMAAHLALRNGAEGRQALRDILRTGPPDERATAALALASEGDAEPFEVLKSELLTGLKERKWVRIILRLMVRHYSARLIAWADAGGRALIDAAGIGWALAKVRIATGNATHEDILHHGPPAARAAAVRELAQQKGADALSKLRQCLQQSQPRKVAQEAFWQIHSLGEAAIPVAEQMLESDHWPERKAGVCLLRRWNRLTPEQHARAKADPHVAVRHAADWHPSWRKAAD